MRVANTRCQHVRVMAVPKDPILVWLDRKGVEGGHTEICKIEISTVNKHKTELLDLRNLAVSKIHLLKRMMLELRVIHVLIVASVSIGARLVDVLIGLLHHIDSWMKLRSWRFLFLDIWIDSRQHWCRSVSHRTANVCGHAFLLVVLLGVAHVDLGELSVEKRMDVKRL